jgi:cytochrome P450
MLGNHQTAHELLDRRSNIYSSRPRFPFMGECVSDGKRILLLPYGDTFRAYRKMQAGFVSARVSDTYRELQDVESKQLAHEFLSTSDFSDRFHRYSSSLMFALAYGKRMPEGDEPEVTGVDKIMRDLDVLFSQRWIVDYLPFLNVLPRCLARWKYIAQKMRKKEVDYFHDVGKVAEQSQAWNWTKEITASKDSHNLTPSQVAYAVGNTYEAASDTTTIVLEAFIMAAVLHPDKMRTAQEELDRVVGRDRLPTFDDMDQLPYIRALVKEVHRWRPVIPGGVPHAVTEDDVYNGHFIPRNSTVIGNHWAISMDPEVYGKPEEFIPERWLENPDLPPPVTFGFGRRKCIGEWTRKYHKYV